MRDTTLLLAIAALLMPFRLATAAENTHLAYTPPPPVVSSGGIAQIIFSLLLVLAIIVLIAWLLKRMNVVRQNSGNLLKVVSGIAIGQRERIVLVEIQDTWLVVGVAQGQIRTLHTLPKQDIPNTNESVQTNPSFEKKFVKLLSSVMQQKPSAKERHAP